MARLYLGECSLNNQLYYVSRLLSFIGINVFDCKWMTGWNKIKDILIMSFSFLILGYALVGHISAALTNFEINIFDFLIPLIVVYGLLTESLQLCWILYFRKDLLQFIDLAKSEVQQQKSEKERKAYSDSMRFNKLITMATIAFHLLCHLTIICHFPFDVKSGFLNRAFVPVGLGVINKSPKFEIVLAVLIICSAVIFFARCGFATLYITLLGHCSSQYRVLRRRINNTVQKMIVSGNIQNENLQKDMKFLIDSHCIIISMISKLKDIYQIIIASNILMIMVIAAIALVISEPTLLLILSTQLFCFAVFSFINELLNTEREHFSNSIYLANWYLASVTHRKYISYLILVASKPLNLTIAKLMVFSLKTFLSSLKFMYSLYALVKSKSV